MSELLAALGQVAAIDPGLAEAELRPVVRRLEARMRVCDECARPFVQKARHRRPRSFCTKACRNKCNNAILRAAVDRARAVAVPLTS